jgi:hypothetical protein
MEQVGPDGILLMTGRDECAGNGHPIRTQYCPGEARGACGRIRQVLGRTRVEIIRLRRCFQLS